MKHTEREREIMERGERLERKEIDRRKREKKG